MEPLKPKRLCRAQAGRPGPELKFSFHIGKIPVLEYTVYAVYHINTHPDPGEMHSCYGCCMMRERGKASHLHGEYMVEMIHRKHYSATENVEVIGGAFVRGCVG